MKENKASITIQASPSDVWSVLTDFDSYHDWNPMFTSAKGKLSGMFVLRYSQIDTCFSFVTIFAHRTFSCYLSWLGCFVEGETLSIKVRLPSRVFCGAPLCKSSLHFVPKVVRSCAATEHGYEPCLIHVCLNNV